MEELRKASDEARANLRNGLVGPAAPSLKLSLALADSVLEILLARSQSKDRASETERRFAQKLKDQGDKLEDNGMILKMQNEAVRSLAKQVKMLEGSALGVRRLMFLIALLIGFSSARKLLVLMHFTHFLEMLDIISLLALWSSFQRPFLATKP